MRTVLVTASVLSAVFLLACAKTVIDDVPATNTEKTEPLPNTKTDGGSTVKDAGTTTKKPPPKDEEEEEPTPTGGVCANEATFDTCLDCCTTEHQQGADTFYGSYLQCLCFDVCATECASSLCSSSGSGTPNATCDACIQTYGNDCQADVSAACSADPDCIAFDKCVGDSQCATKP